MNICLYVEYSISFHFAFMYKLTKMCLDYSYIKNDKHFFACNDTF